MGVPTAALEQHVCLGNTVRVRCPTLDFTMLFEDAVYGVASNTVCSISDITVNSTCADTAALAVLIGRCHGQPICQFQLTHEMFAGTCPNDDANSLWISYRCLEGMFSVIVVAKSSLWWII